MIASARVKLQLLEALGSSLDLRVVLKEAYPLLTRLVAADYGAVGVSSSGRDADFKWTVAEMPAAFFDAYPEMAAHDFVRQSVAKQPNIVIRDQHMVSRSQLEQNVLYRRAREVGAPIEQVMAVMLNVDQRWQGGLSLYRDRRRRFLKKEQALLQELTPAISNAVRNCHLFGATADWKHAFDALLSSRTMAIFQLTADGRELDRSQGATQLLAQWFPGEALGSSLPTSLTAAFQAIRCEGSGGGSRIINKAVPLEVVASALPGHGGRAIWLLSIEQRPDGVTVPEIWRAMLTPREQQVTSGVLQGWDNLLIGAELGCAEATVKRHLQNIFEKLGLESRAMLIVRAAQIRHA